MIAHEDGKIIFRCHHAGCAAEFAVAEPELARPEHAGHKSGLLEAWAAAHDAGWVSKDHPDAGPRHAATGLRSGPLHCYLCPTHKPKEPAHAED